MQYFTCSLVSMRVEPQGEPDMAAFFAKQRPVIASSMVWRQGSSPMLVNYVVSVRQRPDARRLDRRGRRRSWTPKRWSLVGVAAVLFPRPTALASGAPVLLLLAVNAYFLCQFVSTSLG